MFSPSKLPKASKLSNLSKAAKAAESSRASLSPYHSTPLASQLRNLSIGTRTLAKMDSNNKAGSGTSSGASAQEDPKQVLNNPHMLGAQALHKAYNKYNIKPTEPSSDIPRVDHSKAKENQEASKDDASKA